MRLRQLLDRKRTLWVTLALLAAALGVAWLCLPGYLTQRINRELAVVGKYRGHVDRVELRLWDAGVELHGLTLSRRNGQVPVPLLELKHLRVSNGWLDVLRGGGSADIALTGASVQLVDGRGEADSQTGRGIDWWRGLERLAGRPVGDIRVIDAEISFHNYHAEPPIHVRADDFTAMLRRQSDSADQRSVAFDAEGKLYGNRLRVNARFDPYRPGRDFELAATAAGLDITKLNAYTQESIGLAFKSGRLDLSLKLDASKGHLRGSAEPILHDLKVAVGGDPARSSKASPKELMRAVAASLLLKTKQDPGSDRLAQRVSIDAQLGDSQPDTFDGINAIVRETLLRLATR